MKSCISGRNMANHNVDRNNGRSDTELQIQSFIQVCMSRGSTLVQIKVGG